MTFCLFVVAKSGKKRRANAAAFISWRRCNIRLAIMGDIENIMSHLAKAL